MNRRRFIQQAGLATGLLPFLGWPVVQADESSFFELELPDLKGQMSALAHYRGQPLVVNFWASWCPPCVEEMPDLDRLSQSFPQVQFLGLAIDTRRNVDKFLEHTPVRYELLIPGYSGVELMRTLGNSKGGLPFTVLFDPQGQQQDQVLGQIDPDQLAQSIEKLL